MFVQRVRAFGRQSPEPRAEILASGALQIIRVRDLHQVGRPPGEVFRLDEIITLNGFHGFAGGTFAFAPQRLNPSSAPRLPVRGISAFDSQLSTLNHQPCEIGKWHTHLWRLEHPLSHSNSWVEYWGTTEVRKVWNGRANLVELDVKGPAGHIEALSLRLYNPQSHQWGLNFASSAAGSVSPPTIGAFKDGRGEFYDQETFNGRAILVRFVISDIKPDSCRFEQAFSEDGGKTWEVNWIAIDTRIGSDPHFPAKTA